MWLVLQLHFALDPRCRHLSHDTTRTASIDLFMGSDESVFGYVRHFVVVWKSWPDLKARSGVSALCKAHISVLIQDRNGYDGSHDDA